MAEKVIIQPNTLWRRKSVIFSDAVYEVVSHKGDTVSFRVYGYKMEVPFPDDVFLRDFEQLSADEVLKVTGGIFY